MKTQSRHQENDENFIPRLAAFIVSAAATVSVFFSTIKYETALQQRIWIFSALLLAFWMVMLIRSSGVNRYKSWEILAFGAIFCMISIYLLNSVWNSGYLTNDPAAAIAAPAEGIHSDSLLHATVAQSLLHYKKPSLLINSASFYNYHFGSHILMALRYDDTEFKDIWEFRGIKRVDFSG